MLLKNKHHPERLSYYWGKVSISYLALIAMVGVAYAQAPTITTAAQARLYGYRMRSMCAAGKQTSSPPQKGGVCQCVGSVAMNDGLDGGYAGRWNIVSQEVQLSALKAIVSQPLEQQGRSQAVLDAQLPYFIAAEVEDEYDQHCEGTHGYINYVMPGYRKTINKQNK